MSDHHHTGDGHSHHHDHAGHTHKHVRLPVAGTPTWSLLRLSAAARLAGAAGLSLVLWAAVVWVAA